MSLARGIEDEVPGTEALLDRAPVFFPPHGDAAFEHEIGFLDAARVTAHALAARQVDEILAIAARRRAAFADVDELRESRVVPLRLLLAVAHDVPGEKLMARI